MYALCWPRGAQPFGHSTWRASLGHPQAQRVHLIIPIEYQSEVMSPLQKKQMSHPLLHSRNFPRQYGKNHRDQGNS